jgi:hypothetical protein
MNALFLKDLAAKTHRGLRGRVEDGKSGQQVEERTHRYLFAEEDRVDDDGAPAGQAQDRSLAQVPITAFGEAVPERDREFFGLWDSDAMHAANFSR